MSKLLEFCGEESNYLVLEKVIAALKKGMTAEEIIPPVEEFLKPKRKIKTEIDKLRHKARTGDKQAAKEFISKLASMLDGK